MVEWPASPVCFPRHNTMQQSLTKPTIHQETTIEDDFRVGRTKQPTLMKRPQLLFMLALILVDIGSVWFAYYLAHSLLLRRLPVGNLGQFNEFIALPVVHTVLLIIIFFTQRMYQRRRPSTHLNEFFRIISHNTLATLLTVAVMTLLSPNFNYHRSLIAYAWLFVIIVLTIARVLHAQIQWQAQARGIGDERVLLIGTGEVGQLLLDKLCNNPKLGYQVIGIIDENGLRMSDTILDVPVLGKLADIPKVIEDFDVDEVLIGLPENSSHDLVGIISLCEREKVSIRVFPDVFQIMASEVGIDDLGGLPLINVRDVALQGWKLTLKRGMDIIVSAIVLVLISPFMLLLALLIKVDSPGPVFYVQERMGLDAIPFKILKFRSMRVDSEANGPGWTTENDPRKTQLGTIIRRFSLDELPNLINILAGDMSLVGPRPEQPVYVEQFRQSIPRYMDRHREKAGLTGWAQVNGLRGDTSIAERTKYDLWYIENWSILLDFSILIRTILQVLLGTGKNAY